MTPAELCEEANFLRSSLNELAERLSSVYGQLHNTARKGAEGESVYSYLSVANAGRRFSGMILQASRRSSTVEGRLTLAIQREEEEKAQRARDEVQKLESSERRRRSREERADPLEALFGVVNPKMDADQTLIDSELIPNSDLTSDLDDLYGEELV